MPFEPTGKPEETRTPTRRPWARWAVAVAAFVLGMSLTLWQAQADRHLAEAEQRRAFVEAASDIVEAIELQLSDFERLIRTFQSVFLASSHVTTEEFGLVFDNLRDDRARINLQALAFAQRVVGDGRERYVTSIFMPIGGNESIRGLDVNEQPNNLASLLASRDTDEVRMSAPFPLRQTLGKTTAVDGFILRLPVFSGESVPTTEAERRRAFVGSLGASFRVPNLITSVMPPKAGVIAEVLVDDLTDGAPRRLYQHGVASADPDERHQQKIRFGGRTWLVTVHGSSTAAASPWTGTTLWLGTLASLLLAALGWSLVSTRERSIALGIAMSERYRASEERFRKLNELLPCLVLLASRPNGDLVYRNAHARGRLAEGSGHRTLADVLGADAVDTLLREDEALRSADVEITGTHGPFWASAWAAPIEIDDTPMWLVVANDISEQRQLTERLSYQASHDSLTRLLNRREFEARIQGLLAETPRQPGALLFIDLDQLKLINDSSGHRAGDELLVQLASMMRDQLRPEDLLGRLGGDEFGVLLSGVSTVESAMLAAERLRRCLESFVFTWDQRTYMVSGSIGAVMLSSASTLKELFAHADAACYLAKEGGRNRVHFHSDDDVAVTQRLSEMEWANRLRDALRDGRLLLDYQELHAVQPERRGKPHIELLLRLRAEDGREVMPGAFLPAAERYGLMPAIDRWVVETALTNIDRLHPSGDELASCAINLSSASLEDAGVLELIDTLIHRHSIDPTRLIFELTETVAMRDFAASSALISRLRDLGCRVALDDFGAGMSSFGYMKNLALDMVKIDGSFVQELATDRMSQSIVRAVTEIGHQQGLEVVAEWVSSLDMMALLGEMGVDYAQGFALHKPERVLFQRPTQD